MSFIGTIGAQLSRPQGWRGRVVAQIMRLANHRVTQLAIDALDVRPDDQVVDLGCGSGDAVGRLLDRAQDGQVIGIDHSETMIASARRRHPEAQFHVAPFQRLPLATACIDRILATNVAYFWHDDRSVMNELLRVLRPRGRMSVYVTDPDALARLGLGRAGTHRLLDADALVSILGPGSAVTRVHAGWGVTGWLATLQR